MICIGSVEELEKLSGKKVDDIHKHFVDDIEIPSPTGKSPLRRVEEVLDCWFESGSMPYAQQHYPFENKERFERNFPANFIAEGLDQTRGWFYTLVVLGAALFDKPPFSNVVVNGLILADDGQKMSKTQEKLSRSEIRYRHLRCRRYTFVYARFAGSSRGRPQIYRRRYQGNPSRCNDPDVERLQLLRDLRQC